MSSIGNGQDEGTQQLGAETFQLVARKGQLAEWLRLPLFHAAEEGNQGLVDKLIEAGASGEAGWRGPGGRTLLHAAVVGGDESVLDSLIKAGAEPDVNVLTEPPDSISALYMAVVRYNEVVARRLVAHGADVNFRHPGSGSMVLHLAIDAGHEQLAEDMILRGADVLARTPSRSWTSSGMFCMEGLNALHQAVERGSERLVTFLLTKGVEKDKKCGGFTALMLACFVRRGNLTIVEKLLAAGADVNIRGLINTTALIRASGCHHDHREVVPLVQTLLRRGADVHAVDNRGWSALHSAAMDDRAGVVDLLIEAGADIELKDTEGYTPLGLAARGGNAKPLLALLRHGASIDAKNYDGLTPMNAACFDKFAGLEAVVDMLLKSGADETIADIVGYTPASSLDRDIGMEYTPGCEASPGEIDRVRLLLQRAPADRAWRRRGWVVMLRARASRGRTEDAGCKVANAVEGEDEVFRGAVDWLVRVGPKGVFREVVLFL